MAALKERLDAQRRKFRKSAPAKVLAIMEEATENLVRSGISHRVARVGEPAPGFRLPDVDGHLVSSAELLSRGKLVLTFYRGAW